MSSDIALVVFDWDGTVMDSTYSIASSIQLASADLELPVPSIQQASWVIGLSLESALYRAVPDLTAEQMPLFLERYLDEPIEPLISAAADRPVERSAIVEVGNLAASDTGSARLSIIAITYLLAMGGLEWVTFTGNIGLVNSFHRLGLKPVTLCAADPDRLGDERQHWGSYYESKPWVHVGNIRAGFIHLRNIGLFTRLGLPTSIEGACHVA